MSEMINIGTLVADLDLNTTKLERGSLNAERALYLIEKELQELNDKFKTGGMSVADYTSKLGLLTEEQNKLIGAMNAATAATSNAASGARAAAQAKQQLEHQARMAGQALMQMGYIVDDLQYGFSAVVNNIGPFVYQITAAAGASTAMASGVGAAAQVLGVFGYQIVAHWSQISDALGVGIPNKPIEDLKALQKELKATAKEIEDLGKKPRLSLEQKVTLDRDRLKADTLTKAIDEQKDVESIKGAKSKEQREVGSGFKEAVAETGGNKAFDELKSALQDKADREGISLDPARVKELAARKGIVLSDQKAKELSGRKFLQSPHSGDLVTPEKLAQEEFAAAGNGDKDAVGRIQDAVDEKAGGEFHSDFSMQIHRADPKAKEEAKAFDHAKTISDARQKKEEQDKEAEARFVEQDLQESIRNQQQGHQKNKQAKAANTKRAREEAGGVDELAKYSVAASMVGDISPEEARKQVVDYLKSNDSKYSKESEAASKTKGTKDDKAAEAGADKRANAAADDIMKEANKDVKGDVLKKYLEGPDKEKMKKSEQFDASTLAGKIQAGVGKDEQKKTNTYLDQAVKYLAKMADGGQDDMFTQK